MGTRWRIDLFGGLRVTRGDCVVTRFPTQKAGLLLAYLVYHSDRSHSRELLAELLWPGADPPSARQSLSQALSTLRHQLTVPAASTESLFLVDRFSIGVNPDAISTDVAEFDAAFAEAVRATDEPDRIHCLTRAVDLYRGPLLPGSYQDWVLCERERLAERFFQALRRLIGAMEASGDLDSAIDLARRGIALDPLREETHRHLMQLLAASGRPELALRQYRELERLLQQELGETPSRATRTLALTFSDVDAQPLSVADDTILTGNLPPQLTRFFGRETEIAQLCAMLEQGGGESPSLEARLITLTGPGGSGKTRLAIEVGARVMAAWGGRVWLVLLQDLAAAQRIPAAIRDVLGLPRSAGADAVEQVVVALSRLPTLLLLDNFEHLVEEGAAIVRSLLERASTLTCLVTSRRRLGLAGEREFLVPPLPARPSIQLFVDRAQAARPDFAVTAANSGAITDLCARLEGIPLALELAAARATVMTPEEMLGHLAHRFDFLVNRRRNATPRHQTLWTALAWSYQLLAPDLQRFFRQLYLFRGGWTVEAAAAVCEESRALECLEMLRESSLVLVEQRGETSRFRMLETLREFAQELLSEEERLALEQRHAAYFLALAQETEPGLFGSDQKRLLDRLDDEHDNLRAVLAWSQAPDPESTEATARAETGVCLAGLLWWFWWVRGHAREGGDWLQQTLARSEPLGRTPSRAKALYGAGGLAWVQGKHAVGRPLMDASVAMWRELGDSRGLAFALRALGWVALDQGDYAVGRAAVEESLEIYRVLDDKVGIGRSLNFLGCAAYFLEEYDRARALLEDGLALCRETNDEAILGMTLHALGKVARRQGRHSEARACYEESLTVRLHIDDKRGLAQVMEVLAEAAFVDGDPEHAARLLGAAEACRESLGVPLLPHFDWVAEQEQLRAALRAALGEEGFALARAEGRERGWDMAVDELQAMENRARFTTLTDPQWERLRPLLLPPSKRGRPRADDRRTLEGILYVLRSRCRWHDLPARYGSAVTCWRRYTRWRAAGIWAPLWHAFLETLDEHERQVWSVASAATAAASETTVDY
jgi:predicted ATPase/DNA-binding SARP family transcriptional activator/transposase